MGSQSDLETVKAGIEILKDFKADFQVKVLSAHRTPKELAAFVEESTKKGTKVFIAAAGGSAALAGVVAAHSIVPVIGIPIDTKSLKGLDSLLSTVQMPAGIPVASMAIGSAGAKNAALFALEILGLSDKAMAKKMLSFKKTMRSKILSTRLKI
jgi:phosphoribosylaminoimidazole carboxylase PurE protein